jgi:hypothetical protein
MAAIKLANLALRFFVELAALVAVAFWGFHTGGSLLTKLGLGLGAAVLFVVVWGLLMAPRSSRQAPEPWFTLLEVVIFGLATAALAFAGQPILALVFAIVTAINAILCKVWKDAASSQMSLR